MRNGAALANTGTGFDPRAALLSLAGHGLAFGVAAAFAVVTATPDPAPVYAVIFEAPAPALVAVQVAQVQPPAQAAMEIATAAEPMREPESDIAPPVLELPAEPAPPLAEAAPLPKPPRPSPARIIERPAPAPTLARETAAAINEPTETAIEALAQVAYAPAVAAAPAPVAAAPAAIPVVTDARFRERPSPPVYPRRAAELGQRGTAVLRALVQADGSTVDILVWRSSGISSLDEAALGAVRTWRFEPARRDGDAIVAWVEIPVRFELN